MTAFAAFAAAAFYGYGAGIVVIYLMMAAVAAAYAANGYSFQSVAVAANWPRMVRRSLIVGLLWPGLIVQAIRHLFYYRNPER